MIIKIRFSFVNSEILADYFPAGAKEAGHHVGKVALKEAYDMGKKI